MGLAAGAVLLAGTVLRAETEYPRFKLRGYSDINFASTDEDPETGDSDSGFRQGQFVLHVRSRLAARFDFLAELTLSATGSNPEYNSAVERAIVRFDYNDKFQLSAGKFHTPINYWNIAFHHGQWLQTTIDRPQMVRFGGDFIPVHFLGLMLNGAVDFGHREDREGGVAFDYTLGVGNGRESVVSRAGTGGDVNSRRAWLAAFGLVPYKPFGLRVGLSYYDDRITLPSDADFDETISSAHLIWAKGLTEILGEFSRVRHERVATGEVFESDAYYVQVAYRLPYRTPVGSFKIYNRVEDLDIDLGDEVLRSVDTGTISIVGVRLDVSDLVAIKTEFRQIERLLSEPGKQRRADFDGVFLQVSFVF